MTCEQAISKAINDAAFNEESSSSSTARKQMTSDPLRAIVNQVQPVRELMAQIRALEESRKEEITPDALYDMPELFPHLRSHLEGFGVIEDPNTDVNTIDPKQRKESIEKHKPWFRTGRRTRLSDTEMGDYLTQGKGSDVGIFVDALQGKTGDQGRDVQIEQIRRAQLERVITNSVKLIESRAENELLVLQLNPSEAVTLYRDLHSLVKQGGKLGKTAKKALETIGFVAPKISNEDIRLAPFAALERAVNEAYQKLVVEPLAEKSKERIEKIKTALLNKSWQPEFRFELMQLFHQPLDELLSEAVGARDMNGFKAHVSGFLTGDTQSRIQGIATRSIITDEMVNQFIKIIRKAGVEIEPAHVGLMKEFRSLDETAQNNEGEAVQKVPTDQALKTMYKYLHAASKKSTKAFTEILNLLTEGVVDFPEFTREYIDMLAGKYISHPAKEGDDLPVGKEVDPEKARKGRADFRDLILSRFTFLSLKQESEDEWNAFVKPLADLLDLDAKDLLSIRIETPEWLTTAYEHIHGTTGRHNKEETDWEDTAHFGAEAKEARYVGSNIWREEGAFRPRNAKQIFGEDPLHETYHALNYWIGFYQAYESSGLNLQKIFENQATNVSKPESTPKIVVLIDVENFGSFDLSGVLPSSAKLKESGIRSVSVGVSSPLWGNTKEAEINPEVLKNSSHLDSRDPTFAQALRDSGNQEIIDFVNSEAAITNPTLWRLSQILSAYKDAEIGVQIHDANQVIQIQAPAKKKGFFRRLFGR